MISSSIKVISAEFDSYGISLQGLTPRRYPRRVWLRRDIPAGVDSDGISLQGLTPTGYPCRVWLLRDIPAWFASTPHGLTPTGYPCRVWLLLNIPAGFDSFWISLSISKSIHLSIYLILYISPELWNSNWIMTNRKYLKIIVKEKTWRIEVQKETVEE